MEKLGSLKPLFLFWDQVVCALRVGVALLQKKMGNLALGRAERGMALPVVPHKAAAEFSRTGNL